MITKKHQQFAHTVKTNTEIHTTLGIRIHTSYQ